MNADIFDQRVCALGEGPHWHPSPGQLFWFDILGKNAEPEAGSIYRLNKGEVRKLMNKVTVPNSICFAPDRSVAYYADTPTHNIMEVPLSPSDGWPSAEAKVFVDLSSEKLRPDGSVVDKEGCLWNAQWGAGRVPRYGPKGSLVSTHDLLASQSTCPAFGGENLRTVFVTSAADGLNGSQDGKTFRFDADVTGKAEYRVTL